MFHWAQLIGPQIEYPNLSLLNWIKNMNGMLCIHAFLQRGFILDSSEFKLLFQMWWVSVY